MKKVLFIVFLMLCGGFACAQDSIPRQNTKSYLIANGSEKDHAFLKEKSRQAHLLLGLEVLANRIPTDSKMVGPKPSKHLLKQGELQLQLPMDERQDEFAVYHSELFDIPSTINVLQIGDELITYRTMETTGNIHLLYNCVRGAFGTKKTAHAKNEPVYKLWDTPERTLLPDLELQDRMAQTESKKLSKSEYDILVFNNLKSYANESGDTAIRHFLDTMQKYNPDKHLQADLLTPTSQHYLSRINENQVWNASMRTKIVETLTEKQAYYHEHQMPWMIGNFQILLADKNRKATTLEELEWFLSKAAAFDAGFGLDFSEKVLRTHGLTEKMLNAIRIWETLRLAGAFSEQQKEQFKDPYGNWHLEQADDSSCLLYPQHISRRYFCDAEGENWKWDNPYGGRFALQIAVEGKGDISEIHLYTPNGDLYFPCTVKANQYLILDFDGKALVTDPNYNIMETVVPQGTAPLSKGNNEVSFSYEVSPQDKKKPEVTVRYLTRGAAETLLLR